MARLKNALRKHYVAEWTDNNTEPTASDYKLLAKYIKTVNDETDENTNDDAFYDGDGTPETTIVSVAAGYAFEGQYDPEDDAQKLIAGKKYKTGDDRKVWFKVVSSDGKKQWTGAATVTGIKAGDGDAGEYEGFECTIKWNTLPKETPVA